MNLISLRKLRETALQAIAEYFTSNGQIDGGGVHDTSGTIYGRFAHRGQKRRKAYRHGLGRKWNGRG